MLKACLTYISIAGKINNCIGKLLSILPLVITILTASEVIMRYIFKSPTIWIWDLNIQLFALLVTMAGGYTMFAKGHICVDFLTQNISKRKKAILDVVTSFFFFFSMGVILYFGWTIAWESWLKREAMSTLWGPPFYTMKMMIPAAALLLIIQGIAKLLEDLIIIVKGEESLTNE